MKKNFLEAVAYFKRQENLTHTQKVTRLYKASLKTLFDWAETHKVFMKEAYKLRKEFRDNANLDPNSKEAQDLVTKGYEKLLSYKHPDPYVRPWMPGGCTFMRNAPPPLSAVFPHGIPKKIYESVTPVHPDMVPITFRPSNEEILIDFGEKRII